MELVFIQGCSVLVCHFGKDYESTFTGKRRVQIHNALDCKMCLCLVLIDVHDIVGCYLEVSKLEMNHYCLVSKELFAYYPKNFHLESDQQIMLQLQAC